MIALAETVGPSAGNNSDSKKGWNRAKTKRKESVESRKRADKGSNGAGGYLAFASQIAVMVKGGTWAKLSESGRNVLVVLCTHADKESGVCRVGVRKIAKEGGIGEATARRGIRDLETHKLLETSFAPGRSSFYELLLPQSNRADTPIKLIGVTPDTPINLIGITKCTKNEVPVQQHALSQNTPDPHANRSDLVVVLSEFFSKKDAAAITSWPEIEQYGLDYIREKGALTTSKDRDNLLGFMRQALKDDYKPTIPAAERRRMAREDREARERSERLAELRERDRIEAEKQKAGALLRQLTDTERSEIEAEARQILVKEGTTEDNPCYSIRLEAACEDIVLRRAS